MAKIAVEKRKESSMDLLTKEHHKANEAENVDFVTCKENAETLGAFLMAHRDELESEVDSKRPFLSLKGETIYGKKNQRVVGGVIPLFDGVAVDLETALLKGSKAWFKDPEAKGAGGIITILPQGIDTALLIPMDKVSLKPEHIEAHAKSLGEEGLGKYNKVIPHDIVITDEAVHFEEVTLRSWRDEKNPESEEKSIVLKDMQLTQEGLMAPQLASDTLYDFINFEPSARDESSPEEIQEEEAPTESPEEVPEVLSAQAFLDEIFEDGETSEIDIAALLEALAKNVDDAISSLEDALKAMGSNIEDFITSLGNAIEAMPKEFVETLKHMMSTIAQTTKQMSDAMMALVTKIEESIGAFFEGIANIPKEIQDAIKELISKAEKRVSAMINSMGEIIQKAKDALKDFVTKLANLPLEMRNAVLSAIDSMTNFLTSIGDKLLSMGQSLVNGFIAMIDAIASMPENIKKAITEAIGNMISALVSVRDEIIAIAENYAQAVLAGLEALGNIPENILEAVGDMAEHTADALEAAVTTIKETVETAAEAVETVIEKVAELPEQLKDSVEETVETIRDNLNDLGQQIDDTLDAIKEIPETIIDGAEKLVDDAAQAVDDLVDKAKEFVEDTTTAIENAADTLANLPKEVSETITQGLNNIEDAIENGAQAVAAGAKELANTALAKGKETLIEKRDEVGLNPDDVKRNIDAMLHGEITTSADETHRENVKGGAGGKLSASVALPILPGISFKIGAAAAVAMKYNINKDAQNVAAAIEKQQDIREPLEVTLGVNLTGAASISAFISLVLGAEHLLNMEGMLSAAVEMISKLDGNAVAKVGIEGGEPKLYSVELNSTITAAMIAKLDGAIRVNVLIWSKDLVSATLAEAELGSVDGKITLSRNFAGGENWVLDEGHSFKSLAGRGKEKLSSKDALEKFFTSTETRKNLFDENQLNFETLKQEFALAREIVQKYQDTSNNFVIADINKDEGGPSILAKKAVAISNAFYFQYQRNADLVNKHIQSLNDTANNPAVQSAMVKKGELEKQQGELRSIQAIFGEEREGATAEGMERMTGFVAQIKKSEFTTKNFDDSLKQEAKTQLQSPEAYRAYEENRILELKKPFYKRIKSAEDYVTENHLGKDEKSTDLASFYKRKWNNAYEEYFMAATGKGTVLSYLHEKTDDSRKKNKKHIDTHLQRMNKLRALYGVMSEEEQNSPNEMFFQAYAKEGAKALTKNPIFENSTQEMMKAFIEFYIKENRSDSLEFLLKKSALAGDIHERNKLRRQKADKAKTGDHFSQRRQTRLDTAEASVSESINANQKGIRKDMHKIARVEDVILARKRLQKHAEIMKNPGGDAFKDSMRATILARPDALDALIVYERGRKGENNEKLALLQKAKKDYENPASTQTAAERLKARDAAIGKYLDKHRLNVLEKQVRENYRTDILYADRSLTDYEEQDSSLSAYEQMHQFGIRNSKGAVDVHANHEQVAQIVQDRRWDTIHSTDVERYYQYNAEASKAFKADQSAVVALYTIRNTASAQEMMDALNQTPSLKKEYMKYLEGHSSVYVTPQNIMDYEESRFQFYFNPHGAEIDSITENEETGLQAFQNSPMGKDFLSEQRQVVGISYHDVVAMETLAMEAVTAKHVNRLTQLNETNPSSASALEGQGTKVSSSAVKARVTELSGSGAFMSEFTGNYLSQEIGLQDELLGKVSENKESARKELETLNEQMAVCRIISDNAEKALSQPKSILDEFDTFDKTVLTALEQEGERAKTSTKLKESTQKKMQSLSATAEKLLTMRTEEA